MFYEDVDDGLGVVDVVVGVELEFFEFGVLADEVFDRVLEGGDEFGEGGFVGRGFDVEDDFVIDSEFLGDRQGIVRGASMIKVVDGDFGHGGEVALEGGWSRRRELVVSATLGNPSFQAVRWRLGFEDES